MRNRNSYILLTVVDAVGLTIIITGVPQCSAVALDQQEEYQIQYHREKPTVLSVRMCTEIAMYKTPKPRVKTRCYRPRWEREAYINWSLMTSQGSTRSELPWLA